MCTLSAESVIWTHESICWFNFTQHASSQVLHHIHYTAPCLYENLHSKLYLAPKIWGNSYLPGLRALMISSLRLEIPGIINHRICFMQLTLMAPLSPAGQSTVYFFVTPGSAVAPDLLQFSSFCLTYSLHICALFGLFDWASPFWGILE